MVASLQENERSAIIRRGGIKVMFTEGKITTASLGEYKLPTQIDIPRLRTILLPANPGPGPFGAKSVGETNNSAVAAAIANGVRDAVGVRVKELPITAERVFAALHEKSPARS